MKTLDKLRRQMLRHSTKYLRRRLEELEPKPYRRRPQYIAGKWTYNDGLDMADSPRTALAYAVARKLYVRGLNSNYFSNC